ncbi:hypothetical protein A4A49_52734 [Nicotiana attenuata]|uniref:RING-type domain-containing protein n=1 Tax=Nicotiana attenuata TaxID=49451 RepID=A0A1J6JWS9_NICAT|nr:hypothetical protein A4A49_52734 [Nicotiana attenuata]
MCELDMNKTSRDTVGFPLKVTVLVKRRSSKLTSSSYLIDHKAEYVFWIPYDDILSDDASDIISKIIFLMNVPFSLDHKLKWKGVTYRDVATIATLENKDKLISKIVEFARNMLDYAALNISSESTYMVLGITKITYFSQTEFMEIYNNMSEDYNRKTWERTLGEVNSRIAKFEALQKEVRIKKMRFEAKKFEDSDLLDMCSICREEFFTGCIVSCINQCSHVYHGVCILEWLLKDRSCPYCRSELGQKI